MRVHLLLAVVSLSLGCLGATAAVAAEQCSDLQDAQKAKLAEYVAQKFKAPPRVRLDIAENSLVGGTCYRRLVFQSPEGSKVAYRLELFASPDLRFLSKDLMDTTVDPVAEEKRRMESLLAGLTAPGTPVLGSKAAPVTIAVFSDFECPYCARLAGTLKEVLPQDGDRAQLAFHHFPLAMHPWARSAAEAAACAQRQGDSYFWSVHDFLFEDQKSITRDNLLERLVAHTDTLEGFDREKFEHCIMTRDTEAAVERDLAFGRANDVHATPTVYVNGRQTQIVAPEQLRTLIRQLSGARKIAPSAAADAQDAKR